MGWWAGGMDSTTDKIKIKHRCNSDHMSESLMPTAIANLARVYATHRPLVQRGLTVGFVLYVLLAAYQGVVARPPTKNNKDVPARDGKPARVAVSIPLVTCNHRRPQSMLHTYFRSMHYFISASASCLESLSLPSAPRRLFSLSCTPVCWYSGL